MSLKIKKTKKNKLLRLVCIIIYRLHYVYMYACARVYVYVTTLYTLIYTWYLTQLKKTVSSKWLKRKKEIGKYKIATNINVKLCFLLVSIHYSWYYSFLILDDRPK